MSEAYSALADHYDKLMIDFDYAGYYGYVQQYATGKVLELACGTGAMTELLLQRASEVIAVDISREMLNIAEQNNFRNRKFVKFIEASMMDFECMHIMDNVFCVCDGVNYISRQELPQLLALVSKSMKAGGTFVFDISSSYKLKTVVGDNVFYEDNDELTYIWTNKLDIESVEMDVVIFERDGERYTRRDESHRQYIHESVEVEQALQNAGFMIKIVDGESFGNVESDSKRLLFVCKKAYI